jgi:hypothetical protein
LNSVANSFVLLLIVAFALACPVSLHADTGVVEESPAGGLQWTREPSVTMMKERLTISPQKVTVEFEFLNETDEPVTAKVGFPIPEYEYEEPGPYIRSKVWDFNDFTVRVNATPLEYQVEERAFVNGEEHTEILTKFGIDIGTFGDANKNPNDPTEGDDQLTRLSKEQKEELIRLGLMDQDSYPLWSVRTMYHWTQLFPAREIVRICHEYTPVTGECLFTPDSLREKRCGVDGSAKDICVPDDLIEHVKKQVLPTSDGEGLFRVSWVKYILTSANTWKTPINDFELIVDKSGADYALFCWDGEAPQEDARRLVARAKDFIPKKELTVYFLYGIDALKDSGQ